jgi:hypothetical protein
VVHALPDSTGHIHVQICRPPCGKAPEQQASHQQQQPQQPPALKDEEFMDTHLIIGVAVMFGLIGIAASRDLLRRLREQQPQLVPIKIERSGSREQRRDRFDR